MNADEFYIFKDIAFELKGIREQLEILNENIKKEMSK